MIIILRDADGDEVGIIKINREICDVEEDKCIGLYISSVESAEDGELINVMDFVENKFLQKISSKELLEEIQRRIDGF